MRLSPKKISRLLTHSLTPNRPFHVQWMVTNRCNYRCKSCGVWRTKKEVDEVSTEKVKEGLDVLKNLGVLEIVFSGGNPLLRDDIGEIVDYASKTFITTVYDNGSLAASKIDSLRHADFVAISLDTLDEDKYDEMRGVKGAWKNAMNSVEALKHEKMPVGVAATISQYTLNDISGLTQYFTDREVPVWFSLYSYDYTGGDQLFKIGKQDSELEIVDREGVIALCDFLLNLKRRKSGVFITDKTLKVMKQFYADGKRAWKCRALQSFFIINHLGRVAGCHLKKPVAETSNLKDLWNSASFEKLRAEYRRCEECTYLCYMFYSLHPDVLGNIEILRDQWKNFRALIPAAHRT